MPEDVFDEIEGLLDDEQTSTEEGGESEGQKSQQTKDPNIEKNYKNLQEQFRQQNEAMKTMQKTVEEQQSFIDRLTGRDVEKQKLEEESRMRKEWEEDAPNKTASLVNQTKKDLENEITRLRKEVALKDVYKNIEENYGINVNAKEIASKILPIVEQFSVKARLDNPKDVIVNALKIAGMLKDGKSVIPNVSGSSPVHSGGGKKTVTDEAEIIKNRIVKSFNKSGVNNVFGI